MSQPGNCGWNPRLIQVIECELELRGEGTPESPMRRVRQYFSINGEFLAENDEYDAITNQWKTDAAAKRFARSRE